MRGLTFEKPINRHSLSECYTNFLTILRIYRTAMISLFSIIFNSCIQLFNRSKKIQEKQNTQTRNKKFNI